MNKQLADIRKRVEILEKAMQNLKETLRWHTRIGYYIATMLTLSTAKIIIFS